MPNLHIACDFVFDVTRSLLIMQWTRCEYARTTRTRRWDGHLVFLLFLSIFLPLFYILTYLSLFFFYIFSCDFRFQFRRATRKNCLSFQENSSGFFFFIFDFVLRVFLLFSPFISCIICSLIV